MMSTKLHYHLKMYRLTAHIVRGFFICFFIFPWLKKESKKNHIQRWSQRLLTIFNVRINLNLTSASPGSVIVSNHVSWLDIFVINSLAPCRFVAKSDIRGWPMLGWLAERGGTIFLVRGKKADVKRIYHHLIDQIKAGERVAFFPEGYTAPQGEVLPFHANLFEAAIHAKVPVQPFTLRYLNSTGELTPSVEFVGDTSITTSLRNILSEDEIIVELNGLEFIPSEGAHRRDLAITARQAVVAALDNMNSE